MSETKIARRYAKSLVDLCSEAQNHAVIGKQLEDFTATYSASKELQDALSNPVVSLEDKKGILDKLFQKFLFAPTTRNFIFLLIDRGRIGHIQNITRIFGELMDGQSNRVRANVITPMPLDKDALGRIQSVLERLTGGSVLVDAQIDPDLIGGAVIKLGNRILDGSVRSQLSNLRERLHA